jgi:hypothetical protein
MTGRQALIALAIIALAATPGIGEAILVWGQTPEARGLIVGWYAAVVVLAVGLAVTIGGVGV